jgi:hypothetical protein
MAGTSPPLFSKSIFTFQPPENLPLKTKIPLGLFAPAG